MRVAILGDYPLDENQIWGGEQSAFAYLVREMAQIERVDLHVITLAGSALSGQALAEDNGVTVHCLPPLPRWELFKLFPAYRARLNAKLAQIQPDVLHAQGALHHAYAAIRSGYPTVITVHGVQSEDYKHQSNFYLRLRKRLVSLMIERYNLRHTQYLIAISRYVTDYFAKLLRPDAQVYHIPNAIDGNFFELADASAGHTILYAGRVIQRKRPLDLVQAFAKIAQQDPTAQLRVAGECDSESDYAESLKHFVENAGLQDRVHFLGALNEEQVLEEFAGCDFLVLASAQETTPMVIAQAMAAGKPVVATPVGGVTEMIEQEKTGFLVEVGDIDSLAGSLHRLLKDSSLRMRMGQAAHNFAVKNYRADSVANRTYDVYRQMTAVSG